jgi:aryl-alcohol dehydrogenase-like predicted oxidoreductase
MYGLGEAEAELGKFISQKRDEETVFTKFGIHAPKYPAILMHLQSVPRWLFRRIPALKRRGQTLAGFTQPSRDFSVVAARQSLAESLRKLRTDYVDAFLLHDPPKDAVLSDEILEWLEQQRRLGMIREYGVSGEFSSVVDVGRRYPQLRRIVQFPSDALSRTIGGYQRKSNEGVVNFGCVNGLLAKANSAGLNGIGEFKDSTEADRLQAFAEQSVIACVLANPAGVTLVGSSREEHVKGVVKAVENVNRLESWFFETISFWQEEDSAQVNASFRI